MMNKERTMKLIMMSLLLTISCVGHAEIYSCEENGRKIFSQQPCGKDAKTVSLQGDSRKITIDLTKKKTLPKER